MPKGLFLCVSFIRCIIHSLALRLIVIPLCCLILSSCNRQNQDDSLQQQQVQAFDKVAKGTPKSVIKRIDSLRAVTKYPTRQLLLRQYDLYSIFHQRSGDVSTALKYVDSALALIKQMKAETRYFSLYSVLLLRKGDLEFLNHDLVQSNECFYQAQQFVSGNANAVTTSDVLVNIGYILFRQDRFQQACTYFQNALAITEQRNFYRRQEVLDNVALCYAKQDIYDSAIHYFSKAYTLILTKRDSMNPKDLVDSRYYADRALGVVAGNMAMTYDKLGMTDTAIELSKKSIELNATHCCEQPDAQLVQARLTAMYFKKRNLPLMYRSLVDLKKGLDTLPNNTAYLLWMQQAVNYYDATNDPAKALHYYKHYTTVKDSLHALEKSATESDVIKDLQIKAQSADMAVLTKDNQLKNIYLWLGLSVAALAIFIGILVYRNYYKSKKHVLLLRSLNNEINQQKNDLEIANKEKDRILNVVVHDLRNPIGGVQYLSDMILKRETGVSAQSKTFLTLINTASSNALLMVNELLGMNAYRERPELVDTNIDELVQDSVQLHAFKANEKQIELKTFTGSNGAIVKANKERLGRLLGNLITNAIKFSHVGSSVEIRTKCTRDKAIISVSDQGIGIPPAAADSIFKAFSTIRRPGTAGEKSFGLGLSICRQIVEEHGGTIHMESKEGEGTVFTVTLQLA